MRQKLHSMKGKRNITNARKLVVHANAVAIIPNGTNIADP